MSDARTERQPLQLSLFARRTRNATWVARRLNTSWNTVARLIAEGKLEAFKLREGRGPWNIYEDSVAQYEEEIRVKYGLQTRPRDSK
jgi:excisionase family DNA binding protein